MSSGQQRAFLYDLQQILVAYDFASFGASALDVAVAVGARARASVDVLHVVPPMARYVRDILFPYAALGDDEPAILAEVEEHAHAALVAATRPVLERHPEVFPNGEGHLSVVQGPVTEGVRNALLRSNADLLVCGAFGSAPLPGLLGSVARGVLTTAPRPALLVKDPSGVRALRKLLVAYDGSRSAESLLGWAISFALCVGADVELVAVVPDPQRDDPGELLGELRFPREVRKFALDRVTERVRQAVDALYVPFPRQPRFSELSLALHTPIGDPVGGILKCVDRGDFDLLVLGARRPGPTESIRPGQTADAVVRMAGCNTLVIPPELLAPPEDHHAP